MRKRRPFSRLPASQPTGQPAGQPASRPAGQPTSRPARRPANQPDRSSHQATELTKKNTPKRLRKQDVQTLMFKEGASGNGEAFRRRRQQDKTKFPKNDGDDREAYIPHVLAKHCTRAAKLKDCSNKVQTALTACAATCTAARPDRNHIRKGREEDREV